MLVSDSVVGIGDGFPAAFDGAIRYATHVTVNEIDWLRRRGKGFAIVHETQGLSLGRSDGQREGAYVRDRSLQLAAQLGIALPRGLICWLGCWDADTFDVAGGQAYVDGANSELNPAGMLSGPYGSAGMLSRVARWGGAWQCMSSGFWGNRMAWPGSTLVQGWFNNSFDGNRVQRDVWGNWFGSSVVPVPVPAPLIVPSAGQEDGSTMAVCGRPGPNRIDDHVVIGRDGNVWHAVSEPGGFPAMGWENLGSPYGASSPSCRWSGDGSSFEVTCHGPDDHPWRRLWDKTFGWEPHWVRNDTGLIAPARAA